MTTKKVKAALKNFGLPRLIIAGFLLLLLIMAPFRWESFPAFWAPRFPLSLGLQDRFPSWLRS